ncbi:recQ-mediated genome instability protein 1-like [Neltuma alba]|uniref:recQ-mediated genome instability protein 1-like n=1 Tax=Neltuma alba TaxID=207710 RepID=UPI0010A569D9|nr:recQ-mediated genome instability protein 1-like [Prosopis alba]
MVIRRLRLDCSEDDEDNAELAPSPSPPHLETEADLPPQQQTANDLSRSGNAEPFEISDDDFIDVSDSPLPTSPHQHQNPGPQEIPPSSRSNSGEDSGCPISDSLRRLGLNLKREWLDACIRELESSVRGFSGFDVTAKAKLCFEQFLFSDMNYCGSGMLPANVDSIHLVDLPGPYVLQVDEIINISCPLRGRYQQAPPGLKRCLKLSMTDGIQRVFGMEYRPIQALEVCAPAGLKVAICNVHVRHGLLMLVPETIEILGGLVEQLDAARKRLVDELNKPPRGKRTKNGVLPPLAARATLAAWPSRGADDITRINSTMHTTPSIQINNQHASLRVSSAANRLTAEDTPASSAQNAASNLIPDMVSTVEATHVDDTRADSMATQLSATIAMTKEMNINTVNITGANAAGNLSSHAVSSAVEEHNNDTIHIKQQNSVATLCSPIAQNAMEGKTDRSPIIIERALDGSSSRVSNINDVDMVETTDHPMMLSGDQEIPFTYLASLSTKWVTMKDKAPSIQGKIKCFLTGVKGFQYKRRKTYELQAYVDDGSLISEILIDHNIVQKGIGYSPEEVTVALSSEDKKIVQDMKETMRTFQYFLANFEGIMLVELNAKSSLPIAIEMSQGCPPCDAWLLLRRLRFLFPARAQRNCSSDPIQLSP